MTDEKYPLCKRAGLSISLEERYQSGLFTDGTLPSMRGQIFGLINAKDVEAFLEKAPVVYGYWEGKNSEDNPTGWYHENYKESCGEEWIEHQARLILIEPISKDTTDSLLRELVKGYKDCGTKQDGNEFVNEIVERARKILWEDR